MPNRAHFPIHLPVGTNRPATRAFSSACDGAFQKDSKEAVRRQHERDYISLASTCPECHGARLNKRILSCTIGGLSIADCCALSLGECARRS